MPRRSVLIAGALAVAVATGLVQELRSAPVVVPSAAPTTVAPSAPPASSSPAPRSPLDLAAAPDGGPAPTGAGVAAALRAALRDPALGSRVAALVVDASGHALYRRDADLAVTPASTAKLATAAAALHALGPDTRFATRAVAAAPPRAGVLSGDLVLVGGGDPTLSRTPAAGYPRSASLADLAGRVRKAGVRRIAGGVRADAGLFTGPVLAPGWKPTYVTEGSVAPVGALEVDGGRVRPDDDDRFASPDLAAARLFRDALRRAGVAVGEATTRGPAPATAVELARVESPPVAALVERMLVRSDNDLAEALGRHLALAAGRPADFANGAAEVRSALARLGAGGAAAGLRDASGLSRLDRMTVGGLVAVLRLAVDAAHPELRPVLTGLPVAGFTGTLASRYDAGPAATGAGRVRAKTGSLDNVATLAGVATTRSGRVLLFAFVADRLPTRRVGTAAKALDAAAAALARCGCA